MFIWNVLASLKSDYSKKKYASQLRQSCFFIVEVEVFNSNPHEFYDPLYHRLQSEISHSSTLDTCNIPILNPWSKQLLPLWKNLKKEKYLKPLHCDHTLPALAYLWNRTHMRINESAARHYRNPNIIKDCQVGFFNR